MKKVTLILAIFCAISAQSFAQAPTAATATATAEKMEKPVGAPAPKMESWKSLLGLTPEQDAKMKEIGKAYKEKNEAIKNDATLDKDAKKAKSKELQAANETELKAVLSAEQFTKYMEIKKQRSEAKKAQQAAEKN